MGEKEIIWISDRKTFEKLFHQYYPLLCNYAIRFVNDRDVAEDIVQTFFITLWEKRNVNTSVNDFLPYAYRSVKNGCINYYKAEIQREEFYRELRKEWFENIDTKNNFPYKEEVRKAFNRLPDKCRKVFLLKFTSELKYKEIAELTGISVNTVKYHIGEAFRIMREELKHLSLLFIFIFF